MAGVNESPLSLPGFVLLAIRFEYAMYRAHFVITDRLMVNLLVQNCFLTANLKTIHFERGVLVLKRDAVVPFLSLSAQDGDTKICTTQSARCPASTRAQKRDNILDGYATHAVRTERQLHFPEMSQVAVHVCVIA